MVKILISDYPDSMMPTHDYEKEVLIKGLDDCEICVHAFDENNKEAFYEELKDADALLTGFIHMGKEEFDHAPKLKIVSMNATGYDNVDLAEANKRGIGVCPVGEYCTIDVAEFTISSILYLLKNLKRHQKNIDEKHIWEYAEPTAQPRFSDLTIGIIGFGKIGKTVARLAKGLGIKEVLANDPFIDKALFKEHGVTEASPEEIQQRADIICNHMNLNETNYNYFDKKFFEGCKQKPYFINMGRGACAVEPELIAALDEERLRGVAVDVLSDETPDLANHPLVGRDNTLVTPHAAFYTTTSVKELQRISCENIIYFLNKAYDDVFKLVNRDLFD